MAGFKRSSRFGVIGVFVVMAACAAIGLTLGSGEAKPRLALGLMFGIVALYLVILFALQRADVDAASGAGARDSARGPRDVHNPTTMADGELWAALALRPIDAEAARARGATLEAARRGIGMGMLICALIFAGVVPIYLLDTFIPFLVCAPLIALIALWGSFRAIGPGGDVEKAFDQADLAMRPLGLRVVERPDVGLETRGPSMPGYSARLRGALVLEGERHGRRVNVRVADGASAVAVAARSPEFAGKARDGRVRLGEDGPAAVRDALETVPASQRWGGVELRGGPEGIVVDRKRSRGEDWLCDLWLAERVASGLMEEAGAGDEAFQR